MKGYGYKQWWAAPWISGIVLVLIFLLIVFIALQSFKMIFSSVACAQGYLPPERYRQAPAQAVPDEPTEYYAEDWIVIDTKGRTVCKDPYIRKDVKIVQCVSTEPVR